MPEAPNNRVRLEHLKITNFKAIDSLELSFPPPDSPYDPDVYVLGSRNGVGKTSVLEAITLYAAAVPGLARQLEINAGPTHQVSSDLDFSRLVRAGSSTASVNPEFSFQGDSMREILRAPSQRDGAAASGLHNVCDREFGAALQIPISDPPALVKSTLAGFAARVGVSAVSPVLYLSSDRSLPTGPIKRDKASLAADRFRIHAANMILAASGVFHSVPKQEADKSVAQLNKLCLAYADGVPQMDLREDQQYLMFNIGGSLIPFDNLSSGQKEIISTLFLIWETTRTQPGIVLIDEPELHMNAEWRVNFVRTLHDLAPWNQYILATHSADIFGSVLAHQRIVLEPSPRPVTP